MKVGGEARPQKKICPNHVLCFAAAQGMPTLFIPWEVGAFLASTKINKYSCVSVFARIPRASNVFPRYPYLPPSGRQPGGDNLKVEGGGGARRLLVLRSSAPRLFNFILPDMPHSRAHAHTDTKFTLLSSRYVRTLLCERDKSC